MVKNKKGFKKPNVNKRVETVEKSYDSSLLHTRLPSISYMINRRKRRRRIQTPESSEKIGQFCFLEANTNIAIVTQLPKNLVS